ncbi:MAG: Rrf2 family transcriptional regulator [Deltaproteobacteria bacterium]|nr:Rrf2 family transcriptional regulator [Deltaproteobacteria bacterium]
MKISTKGRYGLRVMIELALRHGEGPVMMDTISTCLGVSRKYLYTLLTVLKNAGLVRAIRGARGGFCLHQQPSDITVLDVIEVLEGELSPVGCQDADGKSCERIDRCAARDIWRDLAETIRESLSRLTLAELAERQRGKQPVAPMYFI